MKKTDKNIIIFIILGILAVLMWTFTQYSSTKKNMEEQEEFIQEEENKTEMTEQRMETQEESTKIIPEISASDLNRKISSDDITIIDMRPRTSYDNGHIKGSISSENIDPAQLKRTVVLVTHNGIEDLVMNYYREISSTKTVYNLAGGIASWNKNGHTLLSITNTPSFETTNKIQFVEPRELNTALNDSAQIDDIVIIDTRRYGNYTKSHVAGAINIPLSELENRYKEISHTKTIYAYGADEDASFQAGVLLHDLRFISAKTVKGGFAAWEKYGYPITQ